MKLKFSDKSYIEIAKNDDKILIIISAKDSDNKLKNITNSIELTKEEFNTLISEVV